MALSAMIKPASLNAVRDLNATVENARNAAKRAVEEQKNKELNDKKEVYEQAVRHHNDMMTQTRQLEANLSDLGKEEADRARILIAQNMKECEKLRGEIRHEELLIKARDSNWRPTNSLFVPVRTTQPIVESKRASPEEDPNWRNKFNERDNLIAEKLIEYAQSGGQGFDIEVQDKRCAMSLIHGCCQKDHNITRFASVYDAKGNLVIAHVCGHWGYIALQVQKNIHSELPNGYEFRLLSAGDEATARTRLRKQQEHSKYVALETPPPKIERPTPQPKKEKQRLTGDAWEAQKKEQRLAREQQEKNDHEQRLLEHEERMAVQKKRLNDPNFGAEKPETTIARSKKNGNKKKDAVNVKGGKKK